MELVVGVAKPDFPRIVFAVVHGADEAEDFGRVVADHVPATAFAGLVAAAADQLPPLETRAAARGTAVSQSRATCSPSEQSKAGVLDVRVLQDVFRGCKIDFGDGLARAARQADPNATILLAVDVPDAVAQIEAAGSGWEAPEAPKEHCIRCIFLIEALRVGTTNADLDEEARLSRRR